MTGTSFVFDHLDHGYAHQYVVTSRSNVMDSTKGGNASITGTLYGFHMESFL